MPSRHSKRYLYLQSPTSTGEFYYDSDHTQISGPEEDENGCWFVLTDSELGERAMRLGPFDKATCPPLVLVIRGLRGMEAARLAGCQSGRDILDAQNVVNLGLWFDAFANDSQIDDLAVIEPLILLARADHPREVPLSGHAIQVAVGMITGLQRHNRALEESNARLTAQVAGLEADVIELRREAAALTVVLGDLTRPPAPVPPESAPPPFSPMSFPDNFSAPTAPPAPAPDEHPLS